MRMVSFLLVFILSASSVAAESASKGAPKIQKFNEVERGFWLRTDMGFSVAVTNLFGQDRQSPVWPPSPVLQLEAGFDLGQIASIHLALHGQQISGNRQPKGKEKISNDAGMFAVMLGVRFNLVTTKRLGWFVKAAAGWMFTTPDMAGYDPGFLVQAGSGLEYATMLRHFWVGIEAWGSYDLANSGVMVGVTPSLKYVF